MVRHAGATAALNFSSRSVSFTFADSTQIVMHPIFSVDLPLALLLLARFFIPLSRAADSPPATLKYGTWGFDLSGMDTKTKPGDDFFRYANGAWIDKTQIPSLSGVTFQVAI